MEQEVNKQLIRKYLKGECSSSELQLMLQFLQREDAEQIVDEVWSEEWTEFQEEEISDEEIAHWKNRFLQKRLQSKSWQFWINISSNIIFTRRYAAAWLILLLSFGTWYGISLKSKLTKTTAMTLVECVSPNGQRVKILLSDSSIVYLSGGSKLIYPSCFSGNTREIALQGEAFFEVAKNPKKPFIISTGDIKTLVVGTSFRINAFKSKPFLIEVATGKVRIAHQQGNKQTPLTVLTPGQSMTWKNNQAILGEINVDDVSEWKNGRLVFNGSTLREITSVLERWYNVEVIFKNQVEAKEHITITLTANVPLSEIMEVLARTGKFQYIIKGREVIIN